MRTDRYGKTTHLEVEVISLDTRITKAFAAEGIVPSAVLRATARAVLTAHSSLTAAEAVGYTLSKTDATRRLS